MNEYLKGLDTLRAIAAFVVVWVHIEILKKVNGLANLMDDYYRNLPRGHIAVILFFVISGFLITYLLTKEKDRDGKISLIKFYARRILRIWPLYYLILLLSFILIKADYDEVTVFLCLSIFPNIAHAIGPGWPSSPQVWSIGVEEQFYLVWPLLLRWIPEKKIIATLILFFFGYSILPHAIVLINSRTFHNFELVALLNKIFYGAKFNCMSLGALAGFLYAKKHTWLRFISNRFIAYLSLILSIVFWSYGLKFKYLTDEFYSVLFVVAIYSVVANPKIKIDTTVTSFLGRISFGIYMYHWIIIVLVLKYLPISNNVILYNLNLYVLVILGTILISWLSYNSVEKYFLKLKVRFETK